MAAKEGGPPTEHRSGGEMKLLPDGTYHLAIGSTEMGNGSVTSHRQIAAEIMGSRADQIDIINADTDLTPYDTGTFASTGTVVAGQAVELTARALRVNILEYAAKHTSTDPADWKLEEGYVIRGNQRISLPDLYAAGHAEGLDAGERDAQRVETGYVAGEGDGGGAGGEGVVAGRAEQDERVVAGGAVVRDGRGGQQRVAGGEVERERVIAGRAGQMQLADAGDEGFQRHETATWNAHHSIGRRSTVCFRRSRFPTVE